MRKYSMKNILCAFFPLLSVVFVFCVSWGIGAVLQICFNNNAEDLSDGFENKLSSSLQITDVNANMFWFVQISDIHISKFRSYDQVEDLRSFCLDYLSLIYPDVVIVTGDLTDAKDFRQYGSMQYEDEWIAYSSVLNTCKQYTSKWLDIRGNHDTFNVASQYDARNLFNKYAGSRNMYNKSVYQYIHKTSFGLYAFNGIDIAPNPGPGRPFNFFAVLNKDLLANIYEISLMTTLNATIWFGHYPLSVTTSPHDLRKLLLTGVAYLCGHLHTLLGFFPQMYVVHKEGFMELELGDWKINRRFRIGVFDHDLFTFKDFTFKKSMEPLVVFTNPLDARFSIHNKIPIHKIVQSTHIRLLVFHLYEINKVQVYINNKLICNNTSSEKNLYTCPWQPFLYSNGIHKVVAIVTDELDKSYHNSIDFSFDVRVPLQLSNMIILLLDFHILLRMGFYAIAVNILLLPALLKYSQNVHIRMLWNLLSEACPQITYYIKNDFTFWYLTIYNFYLCIGPLSVGYFLTDQLGVLFSFGIYTSSTLLTGSLTYLYVSFQMVMFTLVSMFCVGDFGVHCRNRTKQSLHVRIILSLLISYEIFASFSFFMSYGWISCFFNGLNTWSLILLVFLFQKIKSKS
ncbi:transmembrane protein 62 isoform X1 [Hydra vulgaris]|uniref:transmembrane protein 62 isoform X1 n=1 Tax=Hydra vulgaris TaxID=6087 RepID=UPI001F5E5084|nr:transmembrane protein 62 [Hydra vulgaris]